MSYDEHWWRTDDHPDAKEHRKHLERTAKEAAEQALAIVPVVPPTPRRKAANQPYITQKQLDRCLFEAGKAMAGELAKRDVRIAELEERPVGLNYAGVWKPDASYPKHSAASHRGSVWAARKEFPTKEPGTANSGWQLACKRGRDGKDAGK